MRQLLCLTLCLLGSVGGVVLRTRPDMSKYASAKVCVSLCVCICFWQLVIQAATCAAHRSQIVYQKHSTNQLRSAFQVFVVKFQTESDLKSVLAFGQFPHDDIIEIVEETLMKPPCLLTLVVLKHVDEFRQLLHSVYHTRSVNFSVR